MRAGDREREDAVASLRKHYVSGRIGLHEFSDRVDLALRARSRADVGVALRELPLVWEDVPLALRTGASKTVRGARRLALLFFVTWLWVAMSVVVNARLRRRRRRRGAFRLRPPGLPRRLGPGDVRALARLAQRRRTHLTGTGEMVEIVLVRHGETEWSRAGKHTGRTDVPLSERGRENAKAVGRALRSRRFTAVLTSPLARARDTCALAGFADVAQERDDLVEWDYGAYEGRTTPEIRQQRPGWTLWRDGVPDGETAEQVAARADRIVAELRESPGDVAVFSHGHLLRLLAARWLGLEPTAGRLFALDAAAIGALGYEREQAVIHRWNEPGTGGL